MPMNQYESRHHHHHHHHQLPVRLLAGLLQIEVWLMRSQSHLGPNLLKKKDGRLRFRLMCVSIYIYTSIYTKINSVETTNSSETTILIPTNITFWPAFPSPNGWMIIPRLNGQSCNISRDICHCEAWRSATGWMFFRGVGPGWMLASQRISIYNFIHILYTYHIHTYF